MMVKITGLNLHRTYIRLYYFHLQAVVFVVVTYAYIDRNEVVLRLLTRTLLNTLANKGLLPITGSSLKGTHFSPVLSQAHEASTTSNSFQSYTYLLFSSSQIESHQIRGPNQFRIIFFISVF